MTIIVDLCVILVIESAIKINFSINNQRISLNKLKKRGFTYCLKVQTARNSSRPFIDMSDTETNYYLNDSMGFVEDLCEWGFDSLRLYSCQL